MTEGAYSGSGTAIDATHSQVSATNIKASRFSQAYWVISNNASNMASNLGASEGLQEQQSPFAWLWFGGIEAGLPDVYHVPILSHGDAWNIDKKTDDGFANTGSTRGDNSSDCYENTDLTDFYQIRGLANFGGENYKGDCVLYFKL